MNKRGTICAAFVLLACICLAACNTGEARSDSQLDPESGSSGVSQSLTESQAEESTSEEASVSEDKTSSPDLELLEKIYNAYSTILVTYESGKLQAKAVDALKSSAEFNPGGSHPTYPTHWESYICDRIEGDLILSNCGYDEVMGAIKTLYNMKNEEQHSVLRERGFVRLPNGKYAGVVPPIHLEGVFSNLDVEYYKEQIGIDYSILQSKSTTHSMTEKSFILFESDGSLSEVQLDMNNELLRIEREEIEAILTEQEQNDPNLQSLLDRQFDPIPYAQGIAYSAQKQQYYVPYAVNHPLPLHIAVFDNNGDLVNTLTFDEIQASSVRYSLVLYQSYLIDENTVIFDGSGYGVSSFLLDLSTETIVLMDGFSSEFRELMKEHGYYRFDGEYKKRLLPPPFTIETGSSENEMVIRLLDDPTTEVTVSSDYYLVDWEETESGFQAILGYLPYSNREQFLKNELQHQPWDYRSPIVS